MAALARLALAHGGTAGLIVEAGAVVAITALMVWALWKNRRTDDESDP